MATKRVLVIFTLLILFISISTRVALSQPGDPVNDGPYIFRVKNELVARWVENSRVKDSPVTAENFDELNKVFNLKCTYEDLKNVYSVKPYFEQEYRLADSIIVITDIHGSFKTYSHLLLTNHVVDKEMNWTFGKGHLVIIGDIFDRGDKVTEVLWHVFALEKQAEKAGGKVHMLIGNHESMVLFKDEEYLNPKYKIVEGITNLKYYDLYSDESVLGAWLRTRPVVITINDIIFIHAGISFELAMKKYKLKEINQKFYNSILGKDFAVVCENPETLFLIDSYGPLWYRGYFEDQGFGESKLKYILQLYGKNHIVVGHTPNDQIKGMFNNKVVGADAGIMYDRPGGLLLIKKGIFYKCDTNGKRQVLQSVNE